MKKIFISILVLAFVSACNQGGKPDKEPESKSPADSLIRGIDSSHIEGMGKIGRLHNVRNAIQRAIDSIDKLPAKAKASAANLSETLKSTLREINDADRSMEEWMPTFNQDSLRDNEGERLKYLGIQKEKVDQIRDAIRRSLNKADSILKAKF